MAAQVPGRRGSARGGVETDRLRRAGYATLDGRPAHRGGFSGRELADALLAEARARVGGKEREAR